VPDTPETGFRRFAGLAVDTWGRRTAGSLLATGPVMEARRATWLASETPGAGRRSPTRPEREGSKRLFLGLAVPGDPSGPEPRRLELSQSSVSGRDFGTLLRSIERIESLRHEVAAFERLLGSLVSTLEARAPGTFEHGARVARIAEAMVCQLGLSWESLELVRRGSLFHDIGTLVLPDRLLSGNGLRRAARVDAFQAHPVVGYALLKGVPSLEPILPFVHRHHERVDGSGFPDGLSGREIPFSVQVVSIADAYDEMTAAAPGTPRSSRERALETLAEEASRGLWDRTLLHPLGIATNRRRPARASTIR
jgi:putative nucleotidyltransferase with HDIG domain